ncbi:MAG: hypothetical protein ACREBJ_01255, partial [Nitrosotalea sp.]
AIDYDKFKSETQNDNYTFRAVSQEWINDQVNCTVTLKNMLVLFFVTDDLGKQRDVTVIIDPTSYEPQSIDVQYDVPNHGGVISNLNNQTMTENFIPFPIDLQNITSQFCNTFIGSSEVDPQVLQFVVKNNPGIIQNSSDPESKKSFISKQFWETVERKIISSDSKFISNDGINNSISLLPQHEISNLMCPGTWGQNGTFKSNNGTARNFAFSANDYNYQFVPVVQTHDAIIPEFPVPVPILLIGITSLIIFYRLTFGLVRK